MEESKVPDIYNTDLSNTTLIQCEYLLKKIIPSKYIVTLSYNSLLIKNNTSIACVRSIHDTIDVTYIHDGNQKETVIYDDYSSLISDITSKILKTI